MTAEWHYDLYVDGAWIADDELPRITVIDPGTEEVIGSVPGSSNKTTLRAIEAARQAFDEGPWRWMRPVERAAALVRMAEALEARAEELHDLIVAETGSVGFLTDFAQGYGSICLLRSNAEQIIRGLDWVEQVAPPSGSPTGVNGWALFREPVGVVAAITPFNYPFNINVSKVSGALAAGCTVVLKPHAWTPLDAIFLAQAADDAGIPAGVLNVISGGAEVGQELTTNPMVDMVTFTGSTATGRQIMASAAATIKRVQLELGGKSAQIILDDVSEEFVHSIGFGEVPFHCGQGCVLQTRLLMPEHLMDAYLSGIPDAVAAVKIGETRDPTTTLGPLIREQQRARVEDMVAGGIAAGATLITGGKRPDFPGKGYFYEPTVLIGDNSMRIAQEEIFGPVLTVIPYSGSNADAIRIANDSIYGLAGGVYAANTGRAFDVARQVRTGGITAKGVLNGADAHASPGSGQGPGWGFDPRSIGQEGAFGGFKQSGIGREWARHGLEEFTEVKSLAWS